ncbi:MAG: flagellin B [Epsilonproteobacteria bacterium]|nr:flagellin B [Campylobacterota bacterium]
MGFRINTNVAALNAHANGVIVNRNLNESLSKLSSGLRINKAADDASGMAIADSLRSQASALGQAIANANDTMNLIQTADKAMDEQIKILDTIKVKATQAAQDGQTAETRQALQADIVRLMEELDNIASQTTFNGQALLSGSFTNKKFQIGAYSNQYVAASIGPTSSDKIGETRFETTALVPVSEGANGLETITLNFKAVDGKNDLTIESVKVSTSAGTGLGVLAEVINKNSNRTGVRATFEVHGTGSKPVQSGTILGLTINDVVIGNIYDVQKNDADGRLINAINSRKADTGVEAFIDPEGKLNLRSIDGRAISIYTASSAAVLGSGSFAQAGSGSASSNVILGRLSLVRLNASDILLSGTNISTIGINSGMAERTVSLRDLRGNFSADVASAAGVNPNSSTWQYGKELSAGLTTLKGAMMAMDIAEAATKVLDRIRSDLGSVQNQLVATINNISVTQVNVKTSESQIRDVDFAQESATFNKNNLLAQAGSFAMSKANAVQQNVMKLLQ